GGWWRPVEARSPPSTPSTTSTILRDASLELPHTGVEFDERGNHELRGLAVGLPFIVHQVCNLEARAEGGRQVSIEGKLHLRLATVHVRHAIRLPRGLQAGLVGTGAVAAGDADVVGSEGHTCELQSR